MASVAVAATTTTTAAETAAASPYSIRNYELYARGDDVTLQTAQTAQDELETSWAGLQMECTPTFAKHIYGQHQRRSGNMYSLGSAACRAAAAARDDRFNSNCLHAALWAPCLLTACAPFEELTVPSTLSDVAADVASKMQELCEKDVQREAAETAFVQLLPAIFQACGSKHSYEIYTQTSGQQVADVWFVPVPTEKGAEASAKHKGSITAELAISKKAACILEIKNEAHSDGDAWKQVKQYYFRSVVLGKSGGLLRSSYSKLPCILATLVGPTLDLYCAAAGMRVLAHSAQSSMSLQVQDAHNVKRVAKYLKRWVQGVDAVAEHILVEEVGRVRAIEAQNADVKASVPAEYRIYAIADVPARLYHDTAFPGPWTVGTQDIVMVQHLARGVYRVLWGGKPAVIKFTQLNCGDAQTALAAGGYAPKVKACQEWMIAGQQWLVIVMDDLVRDGFRTLAQWQELKRFSQADRDAISSKLETLVLPALHGTGHVFYDLRDVNVMARKQGSVWEVQLVDFERCGSAGSLLSVTDLNTAITWPKLRVNGAGEGHTLDKADDFEMLGRLWANPA